ncbi:sensor histidine kinase [Citrifermentans bremense]|uniref:sensor histidine kinase n=1 Tax=Citrifermentans bremense TaxID=60035 RepID=UPI000686FE9A|nr:PAS domain-containing sensor histidine kinase [Citrifermentans bremense]
MTKHPGKQRSTQHAELRRQAEERLKQQHPDQPPLSGPQTQRLLYELRVHQVELELQNIDLRRSRDEAESLLAKYTDLYDFAPIGYFTLDRKGSILGANLSGARLLGVERARLVGRNFGVFLNQATKQIFNDFQREVFAGPGKVSCEVPLATGEDNPRFLQVEAVADESGGECRVAIIDITERRRAGQEIARTRQELVELNKSLSERVAQAVSELRQRDQMLIMQDRQAVMGEMINNIAHQWRQPLNMLGLILQQLPFFYGSGQFSREFLEENVGKGMELINHMSRTIDDFLNFFRSDKEKVVFKVGEVIERTLLLVERTFKDQQIQLSFRHEGGLEIFGHPNEYAQVLLNILMNARDELVARGVGSALISIRAFEQDGRSVVTVTDNAGGVPEAVMGRIFDPYFTTKGADKGTGIGLYMSRTIIEKNMGGRLTVRNTGEGAEFRIEV